MEGGVQCWVMVGPGCGMLGDGGQADESVGGTVVMVGTTWN